MKVRLACFWIASSVLVASCVFPTDMGTCRERFKPCPGDVIDAGAGTNSAGAEPGSGGNAGGAGKGGTGANAGVSAGGAAGSNVGGVAQGGALPCNGACGGSKPVCASNLCVECARDLDCKDPNKRFCNGLNVCVACQHNGDCQDLGTSRCDAGTCKPCTENVQCQHHDDALVCGNGRCVQCTGREYATCGKDAATQIQRVCDSLKQTCTTHKEH